MDGKSETEAADLAKRLRHAVMTASNDDVTQAMTDERARHAARVAAILDAAEFLEEMARAQVSPDAGSSTTAARR